jgi:hypothetical protein
MLVVYSNTPQLHDASVRSASKLLERGVFAG